MKPESPATPTTTPRSAPSIAQLALVAVAVSLAMILAALRAPAGAGAPPGDPSVTPAASPSPTSPSATPSPRPTPTVTPLPTPTPTQTPTPTPSPSPVEPAPPPTTPVAQPIPEPPPQCDYVDVPTRHTAYDAWPRTLLDTIYALPAWYVPPDLVDSSTAGLNGGYALRAILVADLAEMVADARAAGVPIQVVSGYRSYEQQQATFDHWVAVGGYAAALRTSARPGHSEHQLGTAVDLTDAGGAAPWTYADWSATPAGAWVSANAWRYGFVMSYPRDAFPLTCYDYEPWHYRYVGRDLAAHIAGNGLTPRYALWELQ